MESQFAESGGMLEIPTNVYYDVDGLKKEANLYGLDVTFVKAKPFSKNGAKGAVALYAFKNVADVVIPAGGMDMEMMSSRIVANEEISSPDLENAYSFALTPGEGRSTLTINLPELADAIDIDEELDVPGMEEMNEPMDPQTLAAMQAMGNPLGLSGNETGAQIMGQMMGDMKTTIQVIINVNAG